MSVVYFKMITWFVDNWMQEKQMPFQGTLSQTANGVVALSQIFDPGVGNTGTIINKIEHWFLSIGIGADLSLDAAVIVPKEIKDNMEPHATTLD